MNRDVTFPKARHGFDLHNRAVNLSKHTLHWYNRRLEVLEQFLCARRGVAPDALLLAEVSVDDLREFVAYLRGKATKWDTHKFHATEHAPLSPTTLRTYNRALSAFFNWAYREELIASRPHEKLERMKVPIVIEENFSEEEIRVLLKCVGRQPNEHLRARDKALILFLLDTGVRADELCKLTLSNVDVTYQRAKVMGKGMRERYVPLSPATRAALHHYINFHRPYDQEGLDRVFLTHRGNSLDGPLLAKILHTIGERAGVSNVHPHRFRHTALTEFYQNSGGNLFRTQEMAGHASPETTRRYISRSDQNLQDIHATSSAVSRWGLK